MRPMRTWGVAALLLALTACSEPEKQNQFTQLVYDLNVLRTWDNVRKAQGQYPYDQIMGCPPDVNPSLTAAITDERDTAIYDEVTKRTVKVGDVAFLMILDRLGLDWKSFNKDGVFISSLPNRIFGFQWDPGARHRVRNRILALLPPPEEE